jgi:hypothetical protein
VVQPAFINNNSFLFRFTRESQMSPGSVLLVLCTQYSNSFRLVVYILLYYRQYRDDHFNTPWNVHTEEEMAIE